MAESLRKRIIVMRGQMNTKSNVDTEAEIIPLYRTKQSLGGDWKSVDPTTTTYAHLRHAYGFLNRVLFENSLPQCLITMQRKKRVMGYYSNGRFTSFDGLTTTDEIALNPNHFVLGDKETLSTLAHEMTHLWQHHHGNASRPGYHNAEWATKMISIGLIPSHTGQSGGNQIGQRMSHYIEPGGAFDKAASELIQKGFVVAYTEKASHEQQILKIKKSASKTRFCCSKCGQIAWAKPDSEIGCLPCNRPLT